MSLRTRKQDAQAAAKNAQAPAKSAQQQARQVAKSARQQARQATDQVTPLARSASQTARQGVHGARVWAAPRVERSAQVLEERVAPKVADILTSTARGSSRPASPPSLAEGPGRDGHGWRGHRGRGGAARPLVDVRHQAI